MITLTKHEIWSHRWTADDSECTQIQFVNSVVRNMGLMQVKKIIISLEDQPEFEMVKCVQDVSDNQFKKYAYNDYTFFNLCGNELRKFFGKIPSIIYFKLLS